MTQKVILYAKFTKTLNKHWLSNSKTFNSPIQNQQT